MPASSNIAMIGDICSIAHWRYEQHCQRLGLVYDLSPEHGDPCGTGYCESRLIMSARRGKKDGARAANSSLTEYPSNARKRELSINIQKKLCGDR